MKLLNGRDALWTQLEKMELAQWAEQLRSAESGWYAPAKHGTLPKWLDALKSLPAVSAKIGVEGGQVIIAADAEPSFEVEDLRSALMAFHPWRKGPFQFFGIDIDTEWRSNLKWERVSGAIEISGKNILDVGCGNSYYGWRMIDEGASFVLGVEPFLLYAMQFEVARRYDEKQKHFVIPGGDIDLPKDLRAFDLAFSMGVLYHRPNPIDHLQRMRSTLAPGGQLVLETIVVEGPANSVLTPESRYAKMRNVWFLPTIELLSTWLRRSGFCDIELIDVSPTTIAEQRSTDWMTFESLADFLDPKDPAKTIEGYPAPIRAILSARSK